MLAPKPDVGVWSITLWLVYLALHAKGLMG